MNIYLAQRVTASSIRHDGGHEFSSEVIGVFSTKELAEEACTKLWDVILPLKMDEVAPEEPTVPEGTYYPNDK